MNAKDAIFRLRQLWHDANCRRLDASRMGAGTDHTLIAAFIARETQTMEALTLAITALETPRGT
jgi:hypothetical protein